MKRTIPDMQTAALYLANPIVNFLSRTSASGYYFTYVTLTTYFTWRSLQDLPPLKTLTVMSLGLLLWTLIEYLIHRFLFHWRATNKFEQTITFIFHGVHHAHPKEVSRSITPLLFTLPAASIMYYSYHTIFSSYANAMFAGSLLGYTMYTITHDSTHHFAMNAPFLKKLKRHHLQHHYLDNKKNFAVTMPLWDKLFRTST